MSLILSHAIVTINVKSLDANVATGALLQALIPYRDARIISLTSTVNYWSWSLTGDRDLIAAIEYTPEPATG